MATISQAEIASAFLRELGAPDNAVMRKAVIAWMRAESGTTIRANNPWNMTLRAATETGIKPCGSWTSTSSGLTFAAFCSPQDGARASARLLLAGGNDWRGYGRVVTAARAGDPIRFLNALASSAWDAGRYGTKNGGPNKLLSIYASIGGSVDATLLNSSGTPGQEGDSPGEGAASALAKTLSSLASGLNPSSGLKPGDPLGAWDLGHGPIVTFPVGHKLTNADVEFIMAQLTGAGVFDNDPTGTARDLVRATLQHHIGQEWGKPMQDALQSELLNLTGGATGAVFAKLNPLNPIGAIAGAVTQILAALFDPRKWLLFLALIAGAGLTAYGGANVLAAAR